MVEEVAVRPSLFCLEEQFVPLEHIVPQVQSYHCLVQMVPLIAFLVKEVLAHYALLGIFVIRGVQGIPRSHVQKGTGVQRGLAVLFKTCVQVGHIRI